MNIISNTFTITATIWRPTDRVLLQYVTILLLEGQLLFKKKSPGGGGLRYEMDGDARRLA